MLVSLLGTSTDSSEITCAVSALGALAENEGVRSQIVRSGGIQAFLGLLRAQTIDSVQVRALKIYILKPSPTLKPKTRNLNS